MKAGLRVTLYTLAAALLTVLVLVGGVWVWGGSSSSLNMALARAASYLPADQTLEVTDATGSLRQGGHIARLRWTRGALSVEAVDVDIAWSLLPLWDGELRLGKLGVRQLTIDDRRPVTPPGSTEPPAHLQLPIRVDARFAIDKLVWVGPPGLDATSVTGRYKFDSDNHSLDEGQLHISSGTYGVKARLQAQPPMALMVELDGTVQTTVPNSKQALTVQAKASITGSLAGRDALLELQSELRPQLVAVADTALQATLTANIQPWQAQPLVRAQAQWQALNLAALWPQAPQTDLAGAAHVTPAGTGWQAAVQLRNRGSGPWNQQRLPLESLDAQIAFTDGQWVIQSLNALGAGGRIAAQGQASGTSAGAAMASAWQVKATAQGMNPAALDARLEAVVLDGQLTAQQTPSGIHFDARLQSAADQRSAKPGLAKPSDTLRGLKLQTVAAKGVWKSPALQLDHLLVLTPDAKLEGTAAWHIQSGAAEGKLALTLPGATATLDGNLSASSGDGALSAKVTDAARLSLWLDQLPGAPVTLPRALRQGRGELSARWQGGWEQQGQVQGLRLTVTAQFDQDRLRLALQSRLQGGRLNETTWHASLDTASVQIQGLTRTGVWSLSTSDKVQFELQHGARIQVLEVSAGAVRLTGPAPGTARLQWQAARWAQQAAKPGVPAQWQTQGSVHDLPLVWLELLGQTQVANLGLKGDVLFGGQWHASSGDTLTLRATLERTAGDLQLQAPEAPGGLISVGLREASLEVIAQGDTVKAKLRWDSERGGQVRADVSTRLNQQNGTWTWPADAPLAGSVSAKLPPVGAWSVLAPPGWRMRGTLDANATLSGTASAPQWRGTLLAQDLALRSVVDGIDFSQGSLRARLDGQRLEIEDFKLFGAGGVSGGQLVVKGSVAWLPHTADTTGTSAAERIRMDLVAEAQSLRVSTRSDRRLVVSGQVSAQLADARLAISGTLKAMEALLILPDDSTPRLGDDVRVRGPQTSTAPTPAAPTPTGVRVVPNVAITLDLGDNFEVRGRGLNTRLAGSLELRSNADTKQVPRLTGLLRTVRGTYKAYGQQLAIEEGVLRFSGPLDNPSLDILALRPNLQQRVGVQVQGTALAPVVRLYADPDLPDSEKLAWLVLGRSAANGGAESAMLQQAAMALLGGRGPGITARLAQTLGLDALSMGGGANTADGGSTGATVTLGKRLSRDFYVSFERSMADTLGTLYIFYDLSRRLTLRAQSGEQSAVDLIFTLRYD
ncbi:MAG: translocation/assembly module TamB domain-containing protein [Rhodoferax sp.]|nr:translocation/assembly module TamB domain-containing protein [Rhodoferax sp.]